MTAAPVAARSRRRDPSLVVGAVLVAVIVLVAVVSVFWTPWSTIFTDVAHRSVGPGTAGHLLGTDLRGRDIASLLMAGARTTVYVGIVAVGIAAVVGVPLGVLAGMAGPRVSELLLRVTDLWLAFPALLTALILAAVRGASVTTAMIAIGVATVPGFVRVVRTGTRRVMGTDYVQAARVAGVSGPGIALTHVLPNVRGVIIVQCSVSYAIAILAEAALSYLGLGAGPTTASWGRMLYEAQPALSFQPLMLLWPGLAVLLAVLGFTLLGDGLRDRSDPMLEVR
ncbi:ABC transporter permease [Nakamurella flavida]|uniref:ABC transporter permease n=1 Tax=Nakamurella flavida TaxID=363630 RepID=A0A938YHI0_9ACTN|nr:ABC transporter permease [Nakamurella flavida]MBM9475194.1 ABC transporter permease [Nakamurella flavida]MDP9776767.1 peptide/nickel transport system permease protein [Nakamurella flavida]